MSRQIIKGNPGFKRDFDLKQDHLKIAEFFSRTIQGEGISTGVPAAFLRLKDCTLNCIWCDSTEVWREGNPYTYDEIYKLMEENELIEDLKNNTHLVLTGGSPLKQQKSLVKFLKGFIKKYGFKPYIEVENEAVLMIESDFSDLVDQWNNSPKLKNSLQKDKIRYKPDVLINTSKMNNSWFKFVISDISDWEEIKRDFLDSNLIEKNQIILMPEGDNNNKLNQTRAFVADLCAEEGIRMSDRLHVTIWDQKTGV